MLVIGVVYFGQAQVEFSVDTTQIRYGEEISYKIQVETDTTSLVLFPEGQTFLPLEVIESYKIDTTFNQAKITLIKKYGLTQFDSGRFTIPPQKITIDDVDFHTDSLAIEVAPVIVDTTKQKMFTIKPEITVQSPPLDLVKIMIWSFPFLLFFGVIAYFFLRNKKRKKEKEIVLPPYEEALVALDQLDAKELLKNEKSKEYYTHLTEIIKRYLHREVDNTALESTSNELIQRLELHRDAGSFDFDRQTLTKLQQIFSRADLVKFAKMKQEFGQAKADRMAIEEIINETKEIIPEPSEEDLQQNELYLEQQRKKQQQKKIVIGFSAFAFLLLVTVGVFVATYGFTYVKDTIIGHPTKQLVEGRWIKSEYGQPAVILETPKVLVRTVIDIPEEQKAVFKTHETFSYGSLISDFNVSVNTMQYTQPIEADLDKILDGALVGLENMGALNMVVKRDDFNTEKGIKGVRAYGDFKISPEGGTTKQVSYQVIIFAQQGGLQQVIIAHEKDDSYAQKIKERITRSIEIEVTQQNAKK